MGRERKTAEVIRRLKVVRKERSLTLQNIYDMLEADGSALSLTTLKRVFADGSEEINFRYENTLQPLVRVMLMDDIEDSQPGTKEAEEYHSQVQALQSVVELKNVILEEKNAKIEELTAARRHLRIALAVVAVVVLALFVLDLCIPQGWFHVG